MRYAFIKCEDLTGPAFRGAEPVDRATWLCLLAWCYEHENGGRIAGAKAWGDRRWQQTVAVMLKEVQREAPGLWHWDGDDLVVGYYDHAYVEQVRSDSRQGTAGGRATSPAKVDAARRNGALGGRRQEPNTEPNGNPTNNPTPNPTGTQQTTQHDNPPEPNEPKPVCLSVCQSVSLSKSAAAPPPTREQSPPQQPELFEGTDNKPPSTLPKPEPDWFYWRQTHPRIFVSRSDEDGRLADWQALFRRAGHVVMDAMYDALLPGIPAPKGIGYGQALRWINDNTTETPETP